MKISIITLFCLMTLTLASMAQSSQQLGLMPSLNINKKLPADRALNFKAESRQSLYNKQFNYKYLLTDLSLIAAQKISINTTLSAGYLIRISDDKPKHRTIQQLSIVKRYPSFRISHRLATDQTYSNAQAPEFRFRYRIASDIPLQGQSLDPGEFFLKVNNEYLNSFQQNQYDLEIRLAAFLGFQINPDYTLELGLENRTDSFIENNTRHRLWISLNFFQSI